MKLSQVEIDAVENLLSGYGVEITNSRDAGVMIYKDGIYKNNPVIVNLWRFNHDLQIDVICNINPSATKSKADILFSYNVQKGIIYPNLNI